MNTRIGAANRTWTGTVLPPRDFKSLASAYSATAANELTYIILHDSLRFVNRFLKKSCLLFYKKWKEKEKKLFFTENQSDYSVIAILAIAQNSRSLQQLILIMVAF